MDGFVESRREFLRTTGMTAGAILFSRQHLFATGAEAAADYTVHIKAAPIEIAPDRILSTITYNGQFPGPLIRFKEGYQVTVDIFNETDTPEQLHWHGQFVSPDVDGAAEVGTPYIPAHGRRRITFTPGPAGLRFYHTHNRAGADLSAGQYSGQVGLVYIEPKENPGLYDREVFLVLKEFEPTLSRGGDMPQDFLSPSAIDKSLKETGEAAMKLSSHEVCHTATRSVTRSLRSMVGCLVMVNLSESSKASAFCFTF